MKINQGLGFNSKLIKSKDELRHLPDGDFPCLLKPEFTFSGRGFIQLNSMSDINLQKFTKGNFIVEPLHHRIDDFSVLVIDGEMKVKYQTFIGENFDFQGCLLPPVEDGLNFDFNEDMKQVVKQINETLLKKDYSIDGYVYLNDKNLIEVRFLSEFNNRRTLGRCAYELKTKFSGQDMFSFLLMVDRKKIQREKFSYCKYSQSTKSGVLFLSPPFTKKELIFFSGNRDYCESFYKKFISLVPGWNFSIKF